MVHRVGKVKVAPKPKCLASQSAFAHTFCQTATESFIATHQRSCTGNQLHEKPCLKILKKKPNENKQLADIFTDFILILCRMKGGSRCANRLASNALELEPQKRSSFLLHTSEGIELISSFRQIKERTQIEFIRNEESVDLRNTLQGLLDQFVQF